MLQPEQTHTQKLKPNLNHSQLQELHTCAYRYAQLSYTTQHRTVLIIIAQWQLGIAVVVRWC